MYFLYYSYYKILLIYYIILVFGPTMPRIRYIFKLELLTFNFGINDTLLYIPIPSKYISINCISLVEYTAVHVFENDYCHLN